MTSLFALNVFNRGHERLRKARFIFDNHIENQNAFYEECNESIRLSLLSILVENGEVDFQKTRLVQLTQMALQRVGNFEQLRERLEHLEQSGRFESLAMKISESHDTRDFMQSYLADAVEVNEIANDFLSVYLPASKHSNDQSNDQSNDRSNERTN